MKQYIHTKGFVILSVFCMLLGFQGRSQIYNDGTIEYEVLLKSDSDSATARMFKNAKMVLYIRGHQTRTDLLTSLGKTTTFYDEKKGDAVILHEYGNQHIMVRLTPDQFKAVYKKYTNPVIDSKPEVKKINGYTCKSVAIQFSGGDTFLAFYSPDLKFQTRYNGLPVQLEGFPMEYEADMDGIRVIYSVKKIRLDAVTVSLFAIPEEGYREVQFQDLYKP